MSKTFGFVLAGVTTLYACTATVPSAPSGGSPALGPAADLLCASSGKNAFETYGAAAFVKVNQTIFANVVAELGSNGSANLGASFEGIGSGSVPALDDNLATFEGKLAAFLVYVYGGPSSIQYTDGVTYTGDDQDMTEAHSGLGITADQYSYFIASIVVPALTSSGVSSADISSCFAPAITGMPGTAGAGFEASVVGQ